MSDYLTEDMANEILDRELGPSNVKRSMCGGRCGRWSDWFPSTGIADSPPGWIAPTGPHAWASAATCPECAGKEEQ